MVEDDQVIPSDSPQLEYTTFKGQSIQDRKVIDLTSNTGQQYVESVVPALNNNAANDNNMFNI